MKNRRKPDHFTDKAKKEGFKARSVYKLAEIQQKFRMIAAGSRVLDLGAAPGSWSQYLVQNLRASVVAIDLAMVDLPATGALQFIQGDIFDEELKRKIQPLGPFDCLVSDAAPATTGNRLVDTVRSLEIGRRVMAWAEDLLAPGGALVIKIFQGGDETYLLKQMQERFRMARAFKPQACRNESYETFFVGLGLRK